MSLQLTTAQLELIEKAGVMWEKSGLQPAASRIVSLLLISEKVELTFDEIRETLNLSKSATSNALTTLTNFRRIEFITKPGDRKRYFRSNMVEWKTNITEKFEELRKHEQMLREILEQRTDATPEFNKELENMISFTQFFISELPLFLERWKEFKSNNNKSNA